MVIRKCFIKNVSWMKFEYKLVPINIFCKFFLVVEIYDYINYDKYILLRNNTG